jgi:predicted amidohydrolase
MEVVVALAQTSAQVEREVNVRKAMGLIDEAKKRGADLICFPEMSLDIFFPQFRGDRSFFSKAERIPGPLVERFQEKAAKEEISVVMNIYEKVAPGKYFNCSPVISSDGTLLGISRMMHIPELSSYNETFYYWPGDTDYPVFDIGKATIGVPICWDRHFPEQIRILSLKGAEVLVVPTAGSVIPDFRHVWELEIQASAVANQVFIGVANRTGQEPQIEFFGGSFIADPRGQVIARAPEFQEDLLVTSLDLLSIDETRECYPFFKNRRPETYGRLTRIKD